MGQCQQASLADGVCDYFDRDNPKGNHNLPEGCNPETGDCEVSGDEFPGDSCSYFFGGWNTCERCGEAVNDNGECYDCDGATDDICDECGAELGFCEPDCPTREDDYED